MRLIYTQLKGAQIPTFIVVYHKRCWIKSKATNQSLPTVSRYAISPNILYCTSASKTLRIVPLYSSPIGGLQAKPHTLNRFSAQDQGSMTQLVNPTSNCTCINGFLPLVLPCVPYSSYTCKEEHYVIGMIDSTEKMVHSHASTRTSNTVRTPTSCKTNSNLILSRL